MTKKQQQTTINKIRQLQLKHKRILQRMNKDCAAVENKVNDLTDILATKKKSFATVSITYRRDEENALLAAMKAGLPLGVALSIGQTPTANNSKIKNDGVSSPPPFSN